MLANRVRMGSGVGEFYDNSGSPGSPVLIAGDINAGYFGIVPASELITGDSLASRVGISAGTSQFSNESWLKFAYQGKIQFVAKRPIRHTVSWDDINSANCVYGAKTVAIGGLTYKVRLMRGANEDPVGSNSGTINHNSEWNRLMCQIHEEAIDGSWNYPNNIESDIGILEHDLGSGNQGMYRNADLTIASGNGRFSWCQEGTTGSDRLIRGAYGVSDSLIRGRTFAFSSTGWRPVLELV